MASNEGSEVEVDDNNLCCIEATVVSGFEECARGEAREKFNTADVKAVRGKITWKVPIQCVKEVTKMGSIDNCRVVICSVPHFGFTEQHESLSGIQKLVLNMDWDRGLQVWKKFNEFSHPILSKPDIVPAPEDLIDVVIVPPRAKPEKSTDKKSKKGGKWKKQKEERKAKRAEGKNDEPEVVTGNDGGGTTDDQRVSGSVNIDKNGTKTVIVKQLDPNQPPPVIEIKVLIPGPDENIFPTDISEKDQRDLEPMDVDRSMHQPSDVPASDSPSKVVNNKDKADDDKDGAASSSSQPSSLASSPFKQPSAPISILSSAKDFASSVIERLSSSSTSPYSSSYISNDPVASLPSCATPPSTPVHPCLDLFMKARFDKEQPSTSVDACTSNESSLTSHNNQSVESGVDAPNPTISSTTPGLFSSSVDKNQTQEDSGLGNGAIANDTKPETISEVVNEKSVADEGLVNPNANAVSSPVVSPVKKERDPTKPTFRVTCNRVGDNHAFDSSSAAASLGSAIISYFGWSVDLRNFDIEVLLNIDNEEVTVSLGITKTSLHNRNLVAFGPTTLRATICYNMLRLCRVRNGDFVCDPMCGTSAIPIEGSMNWVNCFFFGGDYHEKGIERSLLNIDAVHEQKIQEQRGTLKIGTVQWNIEHFPLRDQCVDIFVSDLPFGHRMGSRSNNRTLYPTLLNAMARTARPGARACLLTEDRSSLIKALQVFGKLWQRRLILSINMGGLSGYVFLLTRTTACYTAPPFPNVKKEEGKETAASPENSAENLPNENDTTLPSSLTEEQVAPEVSDLNKSHNAEVNESVGEKDKEQEKSDR